MLLDPKREAIFKPAWSPEWFADRATVYELWRERALERAHVVGGVVERARRAGAIYRAAALFAAWRRCIAVANFYRDNAHVARYQAEMLGRAP